MLRLRQSVCPLRPSRFCPPAAEISSCPIDGVWLVTSAHQQVGRPIVRRPAVQLAFALLLAAGAAGARAASDAHTRFTQLLAQAEAARHRGDNQSMLATSLQLATLLHHSGPATEQVAVAYAKLGERRQALDWLRELAAMGQSDEAAPGSSAMPACCRKTSTTIRQLGVTCSPACWKKRSCASGREVRRRSSSGRRMAGR